jgi:hypothetical protein
LIQYADFEGALAAEGAPPKKKSKNSPLKANAVPFCKQVSAYAIQTQCKHVALLDWDNLVLFEFHQMNKRLVGDEAKVSWVHEFEQGIGFMEKGFIRKVLLGWLLKAFEDAGIEAKN